MSHALTEEMAEKNKLLPELSREELDELGFGCYGVVDILNTYFTLPTGERLALRLWAPKGYLDISEDKNCVTLIESDRAVDVAEKFPAVLEYLPYRKADSTAERDHRRHPWLVSHGFVVVRADLRGTGDSDGVYHDEHLQQEMDDCCHLIGKITPSPPVVLICLLQTGSPDRTGAMDGLGCTARAGEASMVSSWPFSSPPP